MKAWSEVENSPEYVSLPNDEKQKAKQQYFQQVVAPHVPEADKGIAQQQFFGTHKEQIPVKAEESPKHPNISAMVIGYPVDVVNKMLDTIGMGTGKPVMGSEFLSEKLSPEGMRKSFENLKAENEAILRGDPEAILTRSLSFAPLGMASTASKVAKPAIKEIAENAALAKRTGIDLTPGMISGKKAITLMETAPEKTITGSVAVNPRYQKIREQVQGLSERISPTQTGEVAYEGGIKATGEYGKNFQQWKQLEKQAYDSAFDELPKGTLVPTHKTNEIARKWADELADSVQARGDISGVLEKQMTKPGVFSKGTPDEYIKTGSGERTVKGGLSVYNAPVGKEKFIQRQFKEGAESGYTPFADQSVRGIDLDRRWFSEQSYKAREAGDHTKAMIYKDMSKALEDDLAGFAEIQGGNFAEKYKFARQLHAEGTRDIPGRQTWDALKPLVEKDPSKLSGLIFKPKNVVQAIQSKKAFGDEGWKSLQGSWAEDMVRQAKQGDVFSPVKFETMLSKYDLPTLNVLTSGNPILKQNMKDMAAVGKAMRRYEKFGGNPSGTGQIVGALGQMGAYGGAGIGLYAHDPVLAAVSLAMPYAIGKFATSRTMMKLVTKGLKVPKGSPQARDVAKRILLLSGINQEDAEQ